MDSINEKLEFRKCTNEDLSDIEAIEKCSFTDPWSKSMLLSEIKNENISFFCLWEGSHLVGYVSIMIILDEGFIHNVAVNPVDRRKGYGDLIVKKTLEYSKNMNLEYVLLEVRESNKAGIYLYQKNNFEVIGIRKDYYRKPQEDAIIMKWKGQIG
ncbi:MAG: ribosomal protein S18-alanine N-acetyltransferase [Tissierellales bacterium]|nr:ribosomal protein S18-alanine N-acetyltransferase [Tissierellales bacterium]MBN2828368.1 ribosomal protein S18-alanine N-acetyltransferase [Tissierellales bacterium]